MNLKARAANTAWRLASNFSYKRFQRSLPYCREAQTDLLKEMLKANAESEFGKAASFRKISTPEDFRAAVSINTYETLQPFIERIANGERAVLTSEPVTYFALTAGSGGPAKLIPYNASLKAQFRSAIGAWVSDVFDCMPEIMKGCAYWSISPSIPHSRTPSGIPVGFEEDSAYLGGILKPIVDATVAVPGQVARSQNADQWRKITAVHLLARSDLTLISIWHPSALSLLWNWILDHWVELIEAVKLGFKDESLALTLKPVPGRAKELSLLHQPTPQMVWPRLKLISCWGHGFAANYLPQLSELFPQAKIQPKGLIATEAIVTIPFCGSQPLAINSHFFEFELSSGEVLWSWELEPGMECTPLVSTAGGLYRYRIPDRLRCTNLLEDTPCLEFLGKLGSQSDQFGEKLEETFVSNVLTQILKDENLSPPFVLLAPERNAEGVAYTLYIEALESPPSLATKLEEALMRNVHYSHCRTMGQLLPARVRHVSSGAHERYISHLNTTRCQRPGDIKPMALSPDLGWEKTLGGHADV